MSDQIFSRRLQFDYSRSYIAAEVGGITADNDLNRTNWFNGRFLTAEALRTQDHYWEQRLEMLAQVYAPGIAWGLGVRVDADDDQRIHLEGGLAFNGAGQPIRVNDANQFSIQELLALTGSTGASNPTGAYLLRIEPYNRLWGQAKVYGEVCASPKTVQCEADRTRCGYRVYLDRLDDATVSSDGDDKWQRRGELAAYYFDEYERKLDERWGSGFVVDQATWKAGGARHEGGGARHESDVAVPLAMLYLDDGNMEFLDPWIPRRPLAATRPASRFAHLIGGPTPAAAIARSHQFQYQLAEHWATNSSNNPSFKNLYKRGFRHIPPVGFLPVTVSKDESEECMDFGFAHRFAVNGLAGNYSSLVAGVERGVCDHFRGTNILPYYVVTVNDDDILEHIGRSFEKDPIFLKPVDNLGTSMTGWLSGFLNWLEALSSGSEQAITEFAERAEARITNVLGEVVYGTSKTGEHWLPQTLKDIRNEIETNLDTLARGDLVIVKVIIPLKVERQQVQRDFVVYEKQSILLLDGVFVLLDALHAIVNTWVSIFHGQNIFNVINIFFDNLPKLPGILRQIFAMVVAMPQFMARIIDAVLKHPPLLQFPWGDVLETLLGFQRELGDKGLSLTKKHVSKLTERYGGHSGFGSLIPLFVFLPMQNLLDLVLEIDEAVKKVGHE